MLGVVKINVNENEALSDCDAATYIALYPDFTSLSFLGIMLTGNTMSVGQLLSALFGFDGKGGFDTRIQGIYSTHAGLQRHGASLAACVSACDGFLNILSMCRFDMRQLNKPDSPFIFK